MSVRVVLGERSETQNCIENPWATKTYRDNDERSLLDTDFLVPRKSTRSDYI
jgi:hypothetical protein